MRLNITPTLTLPRQGRGGEPAPTQPRAPRAPSHPPALARIRGVDLAFWIPAGLGIGITAAFLFAILVYAIAGVRP